jgi:hypothetical protein
LSFLWGYPDLISFIQSYVPAQTVISQTFMEKLSVILLQYTLRWVIRNYVPNQVWWRAHDILEVLLIITMHGILYHFKTKIRYQKIVNCICTLAKVWLHGCLYVREGGRQGARREWERGRWWWWAFPLQDEWNKSRQITQKQFRAGRQKPLT